MPYRYKRKVPLKRYQNRKRVVRKPYKRLNNVIKRQALKQMETKERLQTIYTAGLTHGTLYTTYLTFLSQGTSGQTRIADKVFYCGFNIKLQIISSSPYSSLWRFYIIKHRDTQSLADASSFSPSGVSPNLFFRNGDLYPTAMVNTDNINVLLTKTVKIGPRYNGEVAYTKEVFLNKKIMRHFSFRPGSAVDGEHYNYYFLMIPWNNDAAASVGTTTVGNVRATIEQVYKDA
nr:MAG: capsid protein [Virus sp.]